MVDTFHPTITVKVKTVGYPIFIAAGDFGLYAIFHYPCTFADAYMIVGKSSGICLACYTSLKIARKFAGSIARDFPTIEEAIAHYVSKSFTDEDWRVIMAFDSR